MGFTSVSLLFSIFAGDGLASETACSVAVRDVPVLRPARRRQPRLICYPPAQLPRSRALIEQGSRRLHIRHHCCQFNASKTCPNFAPKLLVPEDTFCTLPVLVRRPPRAKHIKMEQSEYRYESIRKRFGIVRALSIRVATIQPGSLEDEMRVTLSVERFDKTHLPEYEALSYVWGSPGNTASIAVGSLTSLRRRRALEVGLRHRQYPDRTAAAAPYQRKPGSRLAPSPISRPAAADVDRRDMYRPVQRRRKGVPGRHDGRNIPARSARCDLARAGGKRQRPCPVTDGRSGLSIRGGLRDGSYSADSGVPRPGLAKRGALLPLDCGDLCCAYHLLSRPWFDRAWVRQEALLANDDAVVMCGSRTIPWRHFRRAWAVIHRRELGRCKLRTALIVRLNSIMRFMNHPKELPLSTLWFHRQGSSCFDPRDGIYAY